MPRHPAAHGERRFVGCSSGSFSSQQWSSPGRRRGWHGEAAPMRLRRALDEISLATTSPKTATKLQAPSWEQSWEGFAAQRAPNLPHSSPEPSPRSDLSAFEQHRDLQRCLSTAPDQGKRRGALPVLLPPQQALDLSGPHRHVPSDPVTARRSTAPFSFSSAHEGDQRQELKVSFSPRKFN